MSKAALLALSSVLVVGTLYSTTFNTYLDTSNPLIASLPHPLAGQSYFANKNNLLNTIFIKKAWGWTSAAFFLLYATSPPSTSSHSRKRLFKWATATLVWISFIMWFFGPSIGSRLTVVSGGECIVRLPSGASVSVPHKYCLDPRPIISVDTHPELFPLPLVLPTDDWRARAKLMRGHDVSGHVFLLTLSVLLLAEDLGVTASMSTAPDGLHGVARMAAYALLGIWLLALWTTALYFHTPIEKLSGYVVGLGGFALVKILPEFAAPTESNPIALEEARRRD